MTARQWIERIADPEIRGKALRNIEKYPLYPNEEVCSIYEAITEAFIWPKGELKYWQELRTRIALLPTPAAREAAEGLLREFAEWFHKAQVANIFIDEGEITDFLNHKYGKDERI